MIGWVLKKINYLLNIPLESQGHVKNRPTVVATVMLIACLVAEIIQRCYFGRPTVTLHQDQGHQNEHEHIICIS